MLTQREMLAKARLTPAELSTMSSWYYDGLGTNTIAEQLGIRQDTVCKRLKDARRKLAAVGLVPQRTLSDPPKTYLVADMARVEETHRIKAMF